MGDEKPKGRAVGGKARMSAMSKAQRVSQAKKAADARWSGDIKQATHGDDAHPLRIGDIELPCYVLEDGTRVLSQRGMIAGLGMSRGSSSREDGGDRLAGFLGGKGISPYVSSELSAAITNPIRFRHPAGGNLAYGYPATILADICDAVLAARREGVLQKQQEHIAHQAEILVRGFARVGIIALVDEATGYQADRARDALAKILESFIAKELQPYVRTFSIDYYRELFRLRGLPFPTDSVRRPQYFGKLTNDIIYKRLAPGVLDELKRVTPRSESTGRHKQHLFRRLTTNTGYPKLREHLGSVVTLMKLSKTYEDFREKLDRLHPRFDETLFLPFDDIEDDETGI